MFNVSKFPLFTKSFHILTIVFVISTIILAMGVKKHHDKQLLEVARTSHFVGCVQMSNMPDICAQIVAATPHSQLIEKLLDSKENEGIMIDEQGKQLSQPEVKDGSSI